jgi:hypothetical protein
LLDEELEKVHQSPTVQLAREIGSPTHKVQLMKASFFMEEEGDLEPGKFICSVIFLSVKLSGYRIIVRKISFLCFQF